MRRVLGIALFGYDVPDSEDFVSPVVTAERGRLHLEARYNYEAVGAASIWVGANFHVGAQWVFDATLVAGGVFGEIEGFAPGYRCVLARSWFELTSEGEYYIDNHDHEENFLYSWTEIAGYPLDWLRTGLAFQRTRAYASDLEVQRGVFVGFTYRTYDASLYVYDPAGDPLYVLGLGLEF